MVLLDGLFELLDGGMVGSCAIPGGKLHHHQHHHQLREKLVLQRPPWLPLDPGSGAGRIPTVPGCCPRVQGKIVEITLDLRVRNAENWSCNRSFLRRKLVAGDNHLFELQLPWTLLEAT